MTPWLYHELKGLGFPVVCMDARRAADALKARPEKTVKADAQALAEMLASGWYSAVHVKSMENHRLKALLGAREQLVNVKRQLYGQVRGLLRPFGIKISARAGGKRFDEEVRSSCNRHDALYLGVAALLDTLARVEVELAGLDKKVRSPLPEAEVPYVFESASLTCTPVERTRWERSTMRRRRRLCVLSTMLLRQSMSPMMLG